MQELVSIIVPTYNSSNFVLDTLESIAKQTYPQLELIVTDDGSQDTTVSIVGTWLSCHNERFNCTCLLESEINTGIAKNLNRGLKKCKGRYIKVIAGDDVLLPNCIEDNINYAVAHDSKILFSQIGVLSELPEDHPTIRTVIRYQKEMMEFFTWSQEKQFKQLMERNYLVGPDYFIERDLLVRWQGYDERFSLEDYPLWLKAVHNKVRLDFFPKKTVLYRIHDQQSIHTSKHELYKRWLLTDEYNIFMYMRKPYLSTLMKWHETLKFYVAFKVLQAGNTKREYRKWRTIMWLSPLKWVRPIKKLIRRIERARLYR